jgi:hypothetical protein
MSNFVFLIDSNKTPMNPIHPAHASELPMYGWSDINWRKLERGVHKLQKRIFQASNRGNVKLVRRLQKLLISSRSARLLAVRRVSQDNHYFIDIVMTQKLSAMAVLAINLTAIVLSLSHQLNQNVSSGMTICW